MVRKGKSRRSKTSRPRDVPSSDESESKGEGEELLLEMPPGWVPPIDHSEPELMSGLEGAEGSPSTPILAIVAPPPSVFSPSLPFVEQLEIAPRPHAQQPGMQPQGDAGGALMAPGPQGVSTAMVGAPLGMEVDIFPTCNCSPTQIVGLA